MKRSVGRLHPGTVLTFIAFLLALGPSSTRVDADATDLFISEYIEGSSNNKALEIYNGTGASIDLGVGGYNVQMYFNGSTAAGLTINLTGTVASGDVFVLAQSSAVAAILAQADQTNGAGWFNGDDAVVLRKGTTVVDVVGQIGLDPGAEWGSGLASTADNTLRRDAGVCEGDTVTDDAFDPATGWTGLATDTFDGLGAHTAECSGPEEDAAPEVSSTFPLNGATDVPAGANLLVTFSEPVTATNTSFTLDCAPSGARTLAVSPAGPTSFAIDPTPDLIPGESCTLTVVANQISDVDANDPPDNLAADEVVGFPVLDACSVPYTTIPSIQGSGPAAAITGTVTTRGVVVGDFEVPGGSGQIRGFYVQDPAGDGNPQTSDGIFVFGGSDRGVSLGDVVMVSGTAGEFQDQTQIAASSVVRCGSGTVAPIDVTLPLSSADALEPFEGMLVRLPQTLYVTEHFQLGRFGQVVMSSGGRLTQPTQIHSPGPDADALQAANNLNRLIIDDDTNVQNPDPIAFGRGGQPLSATNTLRGGDTATGIVGVMTYTWAGNSASGNAFRVRPIGALSGTANFVAVNPRPQAAPERTGSLRVAGMNLLNFFNTFGGACTNGVGGALTDCRGADNAAEFERQWPKTVAAIVGTDADVVGIIEIENDGYDASSAIGFLVDRLNDATDPGTYAFINPDSATGQINALGTDAIKVGVVYKPALVIPVGSAALNSVAFVNGGDSGPRNRPSLAQAFEQIGTGARFVVSVNHLKSKGSGCDAPDAGDGQGECNIVRTNAAHELTQWLATDPTGSGDPDVLILGDLNAYAMEDPVSAITSAGYTNMVPALGGENAYSFVFDGQWGSLDHALANEGLASQITGAEDWFINADEPSILDYNTNFKSAGQLVGLYAADEFRVADHNPVIVDLTLEVDSDGSSFARAFGNLILANPAGLKAGDPGSRTYFTAGAKLARWLRRPVGQINIVLRRTEADGVHLYHVGAWSMTSLQTDRTTGTAIIVATARVRDVTKPFRPVVLDTRATVRITLDDNGRPGALIDRLGITVWNRSNQLWFSSNWDGTKTVDQTIAAGDVRVQ